MDIRRIGDSHFNRGEGSKWFIFLSYNNTAESPYLCIFLNQSLMITDLLPLHCITIYWQFNIWFLTQARGGGQRRIGETHVGKKNARFLTIVKSTFPLAAHPPLWKNDTMCLCCFDINFNYFVPNLPKTYLKLGGGGT